MNGFINESTYKTAIVVLNNLHLFNATTKYGLNAEGLEYLVREVGIGDLSKQDTVAVNWNEIHQVLIGRK